MVVVVLSAPYVTTATMTPFDAPGIRYVDEFPPRASPQQKEFDLFAWKQRVRYEAVRVARLLSRPRGKQARPRVLCTYLPPDPPPPAWMVHRQRNFSRVGQSPY